MDSAIAIHRKLGPRLLESVYEQILAYELDDQGLSVKCQEPITIQYEALNIENAYRADLILNNKVILELKSVELYSRFIKNNC